MTRKKKHVYTILVEDEACYEKIFDIRADNYREAAEKAKDQFIRRHWRRSLLRTAMEDKMDNI